MFCKKCGNKIDGHDKFCKNCGEPVDLEAEDSVVIVPEPPKDMVWNVEGYPTDKKDKKVEEVIFDWKADNQGEGFDVDNFYVDDRQKISAQRVLDREVEKINVNSLVREEAILMAQAHAEEQAGPLNLEPEETEVFPLEAAEPELKEEKEPEMAEEIVAPIPMSDVENLNLANKTEIKYDDIFVDEEEKNQGEKPKGFFLGKLLLAIIIILLLAEGAYLGLNYFLPGNPTVKVMNEKVTQAVLTVESWFEPGEPVKEPVEDSQPVDNPKAQEPIKEGSAQEPVNPYPENVNIKGITTNPDLRYIAGRDYGNSDINQSLPVTESTEAVLRTVVAYDSKWIDYVNKGDRGVLALTAPGSPAEKNTLSFTKAGKIKETFNSLELGEVRKGSKGYYVWVREEIRIEENGSNTAKTYNWIYLVAPIENEMKIVDYFSYK